MWVSSFHGLRSLRNPLSRTRPCQLNRGIHNKHTRMTLSKQTGLVTADWLRKNLSQVSVLDASWHLPQSGRNAKREYEQRRISGAQFFDIDAPGLKDMNSTLPHMIPSAEEFSQKMDDFGISNDDQVIVYATNMFAAAARVWWMFRCFSHDRVAVLDGGLQGWIDANYPLDSGPPAIEPRKKVGYFRAVMNKALVSSIDDVLQNIESECPTVVDARPEDRFNMLKAEPRESTPKGRIPHSINIPSSQVLQGQKYLPQDDLKQLFTSKLGPDWQNHQWLLSCGSGVTASVVALAMNNCDYRDFSVYDGGWSEWANAENVPRVRPESS